MKACDLVVVTGSQDNVRRAYSSGTPAIGVGAGNVPVIIDETANLDEAADKICDSKIFDNATSCSSENAVVIVDAVYDKAIAALERAGAYLCTPRGEAAHCRAALGQGQAQSRPYRSGRRRACPRLRLPPEAQGKAFFMVEEDGVGQSYPFSGEKLALVLTVYRARDFADAKARVREILEHQGKGHSCGIHTTDIGRARELAEDLDVVRVLVNFAHTFGNGGGFNSGLGFTLTMGCGSWQKNSISENLNYRHFLNITHLVTPIPEDKPSERDLFGPHWEQIGYEEDAPMNFLEHVAKARVLAPAGIPVPRAILCETPEAAAQAFTQLGPCVVKAQVPTGKRGKAGGIKSAQLGRRRRAASPRRSSA